MPTTANILSAASSTASMSSASDTAGARLNGDLNDFLLMLTTQLKNQDPTDPLDTNQFTQQLVGFNQVEQQINTNRNLEKLLAINTAAQVNNAVSYIGKSVNTEGNKGVVSGGVGAFAYNLPAGATSAEVTITNSTGNVVFTGAGTTNTGDNVVFWDGKNSVTNVAEPDGIYTISLVAKDAAGTPLKNASTYTTGVVTAVDIRNGSAILSLGTLQVPIEKVLAVRLS